MSTTVNISTLYIKADTTSTNGQPGDLEPPIQSSFTTSKADIHRRRRSALNPMFSRKQIVNFQPIIREELDTLCEKIAQYKDSGRPFAINRAFTAFAGDIITEFAFAKSYDHLESPDFEETFYEPMFAASKSGHVTLQFPWIVSVMDKMPDSIVLKLQPLLHMIRALQRVSSMHDIYDSCIRVSSPNVCRTYGNE